MDPVAQITGITLGGAFFSASLLAALNAWLINRRDSRLAKLAMEKEERDYARQDEVARKAEASSARIEAAATVAADHAREALTAIGENTELTRQIEVQGNSNQTLLVNATRLAADLAGEKRGLAAGRAENTKGEKS